MKHEAAAKNREWKTVARFNDLNIAQICVGLLREHGIESFMPDEGLVSVWPAFRTKRGFIRLQVLAEDEAQAVEVLHHEPAADSEALEIPDAQPEEPVTSTSGLHALFALILFLCVILLMYKFLIGG